MEKKTDLFNELVDDLQIKTKEYLQVQLKKKLDHVNLQGGPLVHIMDQIALKTVHICENCRAILWHS